MARYSHVFASFGFQIFQHDNHDNVEKKRIQARANAAQRHAQIADYSLRDGSDGLVPSTDIVDIV